MRRYIYFSEKYHTTIKISDAVYVLKHRPENSQEYLCSQRLFGNNALFCNSTKTRKSRLISLQIISWTIKNYLAPSRYFWVSIYLLRRIIAYKINCFWPNLPPDVHIMTQINCTTDSATCSPNNLWKRGKHVKTKDDQLKIKTISNIKNSNHRSNVIVM